MARVVLENLTKVFKGPRGEEVYAVKDLNLTVEDKEFVVLVGPSGAGKSTTLRLIAGLEEITRGTVAIEGRVMNQVEPKDHDLAMVFQNHALFPHLTVYENMAFGLKLRKFPKADIERRVRDAAQVLGLTALLERFPRALSGGERQRVAVGRAIVRQPKVFLFDEPLANLDARLRAQMRLELARLHARLAATIIYVTHDQVEAMTLGQRIAVMDSGMVQQVADAMTLYRRPANLFVAGFIGSPPMNLLSGALAQDERGLLFKGAGAGPDGPAGGYALRVAPSSVERLSQRVGQPAILGLRPENVAPAANGVGAQADNVLLARVALVEPMGAETYLHLCVGPDATGQTRVAPAGAPDDRLSRFAAGTRRLAGESVRPACPAARMMGSDGASGVALVARVPPSQRFHPGQLVPIRLEMEQAHFFDPATGAAWAGGGPP
jgi:multiple sugar transport system ATP-binding protein